MTIAAKRYGRIQYPEGSVVIGNAIRPSMVVRGGQFVPFERSAVKLSTGRGECLTSLPVGDAILQSGE
jgi:hypothetical protein